MKELEIIKYIENPGLLKTANVEQLNHVVKEYPYYQGAHILLLKSLKDQNSEAFEKQLHQSSIYISDRDLLLKFLNTEFESDDSVVEEKNEILVQESVENNKKQAGNVPEPKLLKNKNVRRKINDSFEGMGENISETILSQLEFSVLKENHKLEYSSEIYFVEEERTGKNNVITIDIDDDDFKKIRKRDDILQIEEENKEKTENEFVESENFEESFELMESEKDETNDSVAKNTSGEHFDISSYADHEMLKKDNDLIAKFLQVNPRIEPKETNEENIDISEESTKEDSELLSETLIKVYIKQGLFEKAIQSYEKLCLKYPEKNTYFASQIKILQEKLNKQ